MEPDLKGGLQNEILNIYDLDSSGTDVIGQIAAIEVNFKSTCFDGCFAKQINRID